MTQSTFLHLNLNDWQKGLIVTVLSAALTSIYEAIGTGSITGINWNTVLTVSVLAAISYLLKNVLTGVDGEFLSRKDAPVEDCPDKGESNKETG